MANWQGPPTRLTMRQCFRFDAALTIVCGVQTGRPQKRFNQKVAKYGTEGTGRTHGVGSQYFLTTL